MRVLLSEISSVQRGEFQKSADSWLWKTCSMAHRCMRVIFAATLLGQKWVLNSVSHDFD